MSGRNPRRPAPRTGRAARVVRGLWLLGFGRADGFDWFGNDRDALLSSLAPPIGFIVVLGLMLLLQKPSLPVLCLLLLLFCIVLLQPVLAELLARLWKRRSNWMRYATASAWSVWLVIPFYVPAMLFASVLLQFGVGRVNASRGAALLLEAYFFWLHWFLAWKGLGINRLQALATVVILTAVFSALAFGLEPLLLTVTASVSAGLPRPG
ncbi:MAG: hypothetical protein INR65_19580 [Gluconacetobacter diazotrophicus]|nr:hypothetical protein [Gluconacetobacter diazotrophicus]